MCVCSLCVCVCLSHQLDHYRYNIVKSLASALLYLHEEWDEQVIHRNITSSAVTLEPDMTPRVGSFALAEFLSRNEHGHHVISNRSNLRLWILSKLRSCGFKAVVPKSR